MFVAHAPLPPHIKGGNACTDTFDDSDYCNLQVLRVPCHLDKTSRETSTRNKSTSDRRA